MPFSDWVDAVLACLYDKHDTGPLFSDDERVVADESYDSGHTVEECAAAIASTRSWRMDKLSGDLWR